MAKTKTEPMVEHRVTVVVRYPLTGAVPSLEDTVDAVISELAERQQFCTVAAQSAKTVRVPISENGAGR